LTKARIGQEAIACFDNALGIINKYPNVENKSYLDDLFLNRGQAYFSINKFAEAVICYDKAITYNIKNSAAYLEKAQALHLLKKYNDESVALDKLIELEPGNAEAFYKKSLCSALLGKSDVMIESLKKAISIDAKYIELARNERGFSKQRTNKAFIDIVGVVNEYGNTLGNIHNYGNVAVQGDWVFYSYEKLGLWKEKLDGTNKKKICDSYAEEINVIGDWLYCNLIEVTEKDGFNYNPLGFYKMKTDGSEKIKLFDKRIESVNVVGEWIYYSSQSEACKPYKMKTDGTGRIHLSVLPSRCISVYGDWIYYQNGADNSSLYRMDFNGKNNQKVSDITSYRLDINISGDYAYIVGEHPYLGLHKVKKDIPESVNTHGIQLKSFKIKDSFESIKILEDQVSYLNLQDEWLYFIVYSDGIYKMKTDGTEKQKLYAGDVFSLSIAGDWIYFGKWKEDDEYSREGYYKIKKDGTGLQTVISY
jgi:hypothetical protein